MAQGIVRQRPLRLLLVVDVFDPVRTSAAVQVEDLALALSRLGHDCTVLTPDPTVQNPLILEQRDGFRVGRVRSGPLKQTPLIRRALNEVALSWRMWDGFRRSPLAGERYDGVVFYSPSIFFGRFVAKLKNAHKCRAYLILRDVFPDWAVDLGVMRRGPHFWFFKAVANYQYKVADVIGIESEANRRYVRHIRREVEVLRNWIHLGSEPAVRYPVSPELEGKRLLVYAGNIGVAQDLDNLLRLACRLRDLNDVRVLLVGTGTELERVRAEVARLGIANVAFHKEIAPAELRALLRRCHIGVLSLHKRLRSHNVPGKLLSYLEAGLPVLGSVNLGNEVKDTVERAGAGLVTWNGDDDAFERAARQILMNEEDRQAMSRAAAKLCRDRFSSETAAVQIVESVSLPA